MIWKKTTLGSSELKARLLTIDPVARNLLMLIDGTKTEEMFLTYTAGVRIEHFHALVALKLIEPLKADANPSPARSEPTGTPAASVTLTNRSFAMKLTRLISKELGFGGFGLSELAARARTAEQLKGVAERAVELIRQQNGDAAGEKAVRQLFGRDVDG